VLWLYSNKWLKAGQELCMIKCYLARSTNEMHLTYTNITHELFCCNSLQFKEKCVQAYHLYYEV